MTLDAIAALLMLSALLLGAGAVWRWRRGEGPHARRHAVLMALAALVALGNLAILLAPAPRSDPAPASDQRIGESGASRMSR